MRAALVLLVGFAALAETLGLEAILGAFIAGAIVSLADRDEVMTHPEFRRKLEAVGFGFFIPAFFVTSGARFDLDALTASASSLLIADCRVSRLLTQGERVIGARCHRRHVGGAVEQLIIRAEHVFVCGGAIQTPASVTITIRLGADADCPIVRRVAYTLGQQEAQRLVQPRAIAGNAG